jgi:hypothetical protein
MKPIQSIHSFLKHSTQFHNIASKLFNNVFTLDHFAYRSFNIANIIQKYPEYVCERQQFRFSNHVSATWMSHATKPSIFLSQYNGTSTDTDITIDTDQLNHFIYSSKIPSYRFYKELHEHNQYLAWTLLFPDHINHVAFLVDDIEETYHTIDYEFPEYPINNPHSPIQISKDQDLLQFSIKANTIDFNFSDGIFPVPYSFIEFVQRKNGRVGFEDQNAFTIFNSTSSSSN